MQMDAHLDEFGLQFALTYGCGFIRCNFF